MSRPLRKTLALQTAQSPAVTQPGPCMLQTGFLDALADWGPFEALQLDTLALVLTLFGFSNPVTAVSNVTAWLELNGVGVAEFQPILTAQSINVQWPFGSSTNWSEWYAIVNAPQPIPLTAADDIKLRVIGYINSGAGNVAIQLESPRDAAPIVGPPFRGSSLSISGTAGTDE